MKENVKHWWNTSFLGIASTIARLESNRREWRVAALGHAWPDIKAAMVREACNDTGLPMRIVEAWMVKAVERPVQLWRRLIVESKCGLPFSLLHTDLRYRIIEALFLDYSTR
jgi:hypothetical protein